MSTLDPREAAPHLPFWLLAGIGLVAGLLSGAFGVGGGILIVPALVLIASMHQRVAHGTSLAAVIPISVVGATVYVVSGHVDLRITALLVVGTVVGAVWGVRLLSWLPEGILRWLFIAFILLSAVRMIFEVPDRHGTIALTGWIMVVLVLVGLATGLLSGLLGVGGGVFMVPVMIVFLGMSDVVSKGVSLVVVIPTGVVATFFSLRRGNVDLRAAGIIGISGAITTVGGAALAFWLNPAVASILFAVFLLVVAIRMAIHAIRTRRGKPAVGKAREVH